MSWIRVCGEHEMAPGELAVVHDGNTPILVLNHEGRFYAWEDRCSHADFELSAGPFDARAGSIECVLHGARFDVVTGTALCPPAQSPLVKFPVKVEAGAVWTRDDR